MKSKKVRPRCATQAARAVVMGTARMSVLLPTMALIISSMVVSLLTITHQGSWAGLSAKKIKTANEDPA